ncbi:glycosyltransferase [Candidatus Saccharibacteria bacterium]|nr:glycosyltransferase [Candidatus Saccharibacteria bacterium]
MKIIVLTDHFGNGGAERVASLVINGLSAKETNEVHVCVFEDLNNYNMDRNRVSFHLLASPERSHITNAFLKIWNLAKVMRDVGADVVYSFGPIMAGYVYLAKKISGKKMRVIASERNDPRYEPVAKWKKVVRNYCYNKADILVCQTPMAVEILRNLYGVKTHAVIIPNPVTPNLPKWHGKNSKKIITAARLTEQKNLPLLIDAFELLHKEYPSYSLTIYGEGELKSYLIEYVQRKRLSDCVSLPGFSKDIHKEMASAFMYVSSSDYEGISNSMLESLGVGLPCVCTDCPVGGAAMVIENEKSGLLTKVGDVYGLYNAMKKLIDNSSMALSISTLSREVNNEFSLEKITARWSELAKKEGLSV